ncbi:unnamed protein product, partial [Mesorhabditis belari]
MGWAVGAAARALRFGAIRIQTRQSTTSVMFHFEKHPISTEQDATELAKRYTEREQDLLRAALLTALQERKKNNGVTSILSPEETRALFAFNAIPFIGFGFLDNMIMILAGEYIDQQLGTLLCLSTMAAAAIGNIISDVAGVGLAHYVEAIVVRFGVRQPVLTAEQLESNKARWTTNAARAFGLTVGCIIGMFPLLFYDEKEKKISSEK